MKFFLGFLGTTIGSSVGWWLGDRVGFITACYMSLLGMGVGLYAGRRLWLAYKDSID